MRFRFLFSSARFALFVASTVQAQTLGTITGEVRDAPGAIVPGAAITVLNTATNGVRNATTGRSVTGTDLCHTDNTLRCREWPVWS